MEDNKKKIAIVALVVFTVFAIAAITVIIYLNTKLNIKETNIEEPQVITSEVKKVEETKPTTSKSTNATAPTVPTTPTAPKVEVKEEATSSKAEEANPVIEKKAEQEVVVDTPPAIVEEVKDPNYEDFKFVQNLDIYGYNCVVTSTDGMTTITYPSELVPVDFLLYVAKEVAEAYPEECSYVTFALDKDLIILSYPTTFTEFDTWLYLDVLASDIPIFASWLYDGTYESVKVEEAPQEVYETAAPAESVVESKPVEIPYDPSTPLPTAPVISSVDTTELKEDEQNTEVIEKVADNKSIALSGYVSGGYVGSYVDKLSNGITLGLGLELENLVTFDKLSVGLGLDVGLELFDYYNNIHTYLTLNARYFINQKLSVAGKLGARLLFDENPNSGIFSIGKYNAHFGLVLGADVRYMFSKHMGFGLDLRYSYLLDLGHRAEAKAYFSCTF